MKLIREQSTICCGSCEDMNMCHGSQRMHLMVWFLWVWLLKKSLLLSGQSCLKLLI